MGFSAIIAGFKAVCVAHRLNYMVSILKFNSLYILLIGNNDYLCAPEREERFFLS